MKARVCILFLCLAWLSVTSVVAKPRADRQHMRDLEQNAKNLARSVDAVTKSVSAQ